jgi:ABC-type Fe3+-hydroxamate transport system substrate-binding protein
MAYRLALIGAILLALAGSRAAQKRIDVPTQPQVSPRWQCRRIVSLDPGITETLVELGLGDCLVGARAGSGSADRNVCPTGYNVGPADGCYYGSVESVLWRKPDLVIALDEQAAARASFEKLGLETLVVSHQSIDAIIDSFHTIGRVCGRGPEGRQMARDFQSRIDLIRSRTRALARPSVLFVLDRASTCGGSTDLRVAGGDSRINALVELAGGQNACRQRGVPRPIVSIADIVRLNPDVIVELVPFDLVEKTGRQAILDGDQWKELQNVQAVKNHRTYVFDSDSAAVPGPRLLRFVEELAEEIHREYE